LQKNVSPKTDPCHILKLALSKKTIKYEIFKKIYRTKMFFQKFDILINKQAGPLTNFNYEVTKLPSSVAGPKF
jgi:hypothetical protein